jgi:hypothetical protein
MLPGASQPFFSLDRDRSLVTAFPSPATTLACTSPIPGSKVLTCYFAPCYLAHLPVRPFCSTTKPGSPRPRPLRRFWPVTASPNSPADCASCLHSPSGLLRPSRSKHSAEFAACQPTFRTRPISSRSPQPVSITRFLGCGSSFLVRYVSGGLLFLKPLGTSPTMPSQPFLVNLFLMRRRAFPQVLSAMFRSSYRSVT